MKQDIFKNTQPLVVDHVLERFKETFKDTANLDLSRLDSIYAEDVEFIDPIHQIQGRKALKDYMQRLCGDVDVCRFEYLDQVHSEGKCFIKWDMHFSHPSLKAGVHKVRGCTQIYYHSQIYYQEDVYDMGQMIYENVPLIGRIISWLKIRLSDQEGDKKGEQS